MSSEEDKKKQFFEAQEEIKKLFETVTSAPLEEIKKKFESLIASSQNDEEKLTISSITKHHKEGNGRTLLHFAASRGDIEVFKYLSSEDNEDLLNDLDNNGNTPLFIAVQHDNLPLVKYIIEERHADIKKARSGGATILHIACSTGNTGLVEYLADKGADIDAPSDVGTPLQWAISSGKPEIVKILLKKGANPNSTSAQQEHMPPPLILAIDSRNNELFQLLLQHGADVNSKDKEGWSALQFAAEIGDATLCKTLIDNGADSNYECRNQTALELAFMYGHMEVVSYLRHLTKKSIDGKEHKIEAKTTEQKEETVNLEEAEKLKNEGNKLFADKKFEEALKKYEEALSHDRNSENSAAIYSNKALCLLRLKKLQEALEAAQHSKRVNPEWVKGYLREAQIYEAMEEFGEAAASYFEALKIDPNNVDAKREFDYALERGKAQHAKKMKGGR